jgi:hypothetical protein
MRKLFGMACICTMFAWLVLIVPAVAAQSGSTVVNAAADGSFSVDVNVTNHDPNGWHDFNYDCKNESGLTARPNPDHEQIGPKKSSTVTCKGQLKEGVREGTFELTITYVNPEGELVVETLRFTVKRP